MLEFIRTHRRLMQFLLLLIIFPSFAFFGLESYTRMSDRDEPVAKVAGQNVTQQELNAAHGRQLDRFRQMFGEQFNPAMFDTPEARQGVLDNLIAQKALGAYVADNYLTVSDDTVRKTIVEIQGLTGEDGKFDKERYKALLAAQGMTPDKFEAGLRRDLAIQQSNAVIQGTAFSPKAVAARIATINQQVRNVQELPFTPAAFKSQAKITDAMLQDYYTKNAAQFEIPETIKAEYVVLSAELVESQIKVNDADIKTYYDQNLARYKTEEQRRASHILISAGKAASAVEKANAKAKAEKVLEQLRKSPADFAKLAKENSQDPGSAERGGDLDFFGKGMMVKPFEDTAFKLKDGEISGLVESDFGYHIIRLTAIKPAAVRSLAEVKDNIVDEIKRQQAAKKFAEMSEQFTNMVYEQADSLKPAADKLGLKIETVTSLTRKPNPALPKGAAYNQPKFLAALFTDEATRNKRNTEAVEVAPHVLVAGHVLEYKPVTKSPLAEVKAVVEERVASIEAGQLAKKAGETKLAELRTGADAEFGASVAVSRNKADGVPGQALSAIMKADIRKLPAFVGVTLPGRGYSIYRINSVNADTVDEVILKAEQQQVDEYLAAQEMAAYLGVVKKRAKAEVLKPLAAAKPAPASAPATQQ